MDDQRITVGHGGGDTRLEDCVTAITHDHEIGAEAGRCLLQGGGQATCGDQVGIEVAPDDPGR
ncbi:hypothetical protein ACFYYN_14405 [Streptomyces sp. NPDC001902]